jgi:hypothetical protein
MQEPCKILFAHPLSLTSNYGNDTKSPMETKIRSQQPSNQPGNQRSLLGSVHSPHTLSWWSSLDDRGDGTTRTGKIEFCPVCVVSTRHVRMNERVWNARRTILNSGHRTRYFAKLEENQVINCFYNFLFIIHILLCHCLQTVLTWKSSPSFDFIKQQYTAEIKSMQRIPFQCIGGGRPDPRSSSAFQLSITNHFVSFLTTYLHST